MNNKIANPNAPKRIFLCSSSASRIPLRSSSKYIIVAHYQRFSFATLTSKAVPVLPDLSHCSDVRQDVLQKDMTKNLLQTMQNTEFDYIVLDFLDERYGLVKYMDNVFLTNSYDLTESGVLADQQKPHTITSNTEEFFKIWTFGIDRFIVFCKLNNLLDKLFINQLYLAKNLSNGKAIPFYSEDRVQEINTVLAKMYDYLHKKMPSENFILYDKANLIADADHVFGAAPFHYTKDVYRHFSEQLNGKLDI